MFQNYKKVEKKSEKINKINEMSIKKYFSLRRFKRVNL